MPKQVVFIRNLLILATLIGLVLFGWLVGHILRYSTPALWHPPIRETDPQIRYGVEFEHDGIRRSVVLSGLATEKLLSSIQIPVDKKLISISCQGHTYYTSLPAKCRTADGRLVQVSEFESNVILIPQRK